MVRSKLTAYPEADSTILETVVMARSDYERIERAIRFVEGNFKEQPNLKTIAQHVHLSEFHFQRLFKRWAGISPKQFLQFLTVEYAKEMLRESRSVLDVTYEAGLSSPSRLHDLFVSVEAVTPGEFKKNGLNLSISYGFHKSPFGECLLAVTQRGICGLEFVATNNQNTVLESLVRRWNTARVRRDTKRTKPIFERILASLNESQSTELSLFLKGTNFQIKVWQALLRIPSGVLVSYEDIACSVSGPNASRAVGHAIGQNPVALLIPCHRVIRKIGAANGYRWGTARKKALIGWEAAHCCRSKTTCRIP